MNSVASRPRLFSALFALFSSSIGMKVLMAITGVVVWGFVIGHMVGNLQIFLPAPEGGYWGKQINDYAHFLKSTPALLWGTRIAVGGAMVVHIITGIKLAAANRASRPNRYAHGLKAKESSLLSRLMPLSGLIVGAFIVFHLLHFTIPGLFPEYHALRDAKGLHDVATMVRTAFSNPIFVAVYIVGNTLLIMHLFHGSVSFLQSLGINHEGWSPGLRLGARAVVLAIALGNLSIPLVVYSWALQGA